MSGKPEIGIFCQKLENKSEIRKNMWSTMNDVLAMNHSGKKKLMQSVIDGEIIQRIFFRISLAIN